MTRYIAALFVGGPADGTVFEIDGDRNHIDIISDVDRKTIRYHKQEVLFGGSYYYIFALGDIDNLSRVYSMLSEQGIQPVAHVPRHADDKRN